MQFSKYVLSSLAAESGFLIMQLVMEESIWENFSPSYTYSMY
jgi:hypothetical protein